MSELQAPMSSLAAAVSSAFVINLSDRRDRWIQTYKHIREDLGWNIELHRHSAVDARGWSTQPGLEPIPSFAPYVRASELPVIARGYRTAEWQLSRGAVGCYLSHLQLWSLFAANASQEYMLVFEDDVKWYRPTIVPLAELVREMAAIPDDWDILSLGNPTFEAYKHQGYSQIFRFWGTYAYIIRRRALPKILPNALPMVTQIDAYLGMCAKTRGLRIYSITPMAFWITEQDTDVQVPLIAPPRTSATA